MDILTPRLRLRRARPDDLDDLWRIFSNPDAMRYWSTLAHADIEETRRWLADMIAVDPAISEEFVIEYRGRAIGKAGCWRLPEVGFILHPDFWGQGLAKEALGAVIARVFERFAVEALIADVDPRNERCLGLLRRFGFAETHRAARTYRLGDEWCDSVYLALPRPA